MNVVNTDLNYSEDELSEIIVHAALQVHEELGPGLLESVYEKCLLYELEKAGVSVVAQALLPVEYKEIHIESGLRLDLWVEQKVIVEIKAVKTLEDIHTAQLLTYLKMTDNRLGLLINFNVTLIKNGIKRIVNGL